MRDRISRKRQADQFGVLFAAGIGKDTGRKLAKFAEGDFHRAKREL